MTRKVFPSIRTRLVSRCGLPVQWVVSASVNLSAGDQMLKYGSHATNGTEGGRKCFCVGNNCSAKNAQE